MSQFISLEYGKHTSRSTSDENFNQYTSTGCTHLLDRLFTNSPLYSQESLLHDQFVHARMRRMRPLHWPCCSVSPRVVVFCFMSVRKISGNSMANERDPQVGANEGENSAEVSRTRTFHATLGTSTKHYAPLTLLWSPVMDSLSRVRSIPVALSFILKQDASSIVTYPIITAVVVGFLVLTSIVLGFVFWGPKI